MSIPDAGKELRTKIAATIVVVVPLLCVIAAAFLSWGSFIHLQDLILLVVFYTIAMLGITVGYHRMLTHQGFSAPSWLRALLLIAGSMAFEGGPAQWTATHIKHHAFSDEEDDPHTPFAGFWHAHIGWIFQSKNFVPIKDYAPHLLEDRVVMTVEKYWYLFALMGIALPMTIGGVLGGWMGALTGGIWGAGVRIFLNTHATYSVNSICHLFGQRTFETTDESRNHWLVGLLAFGEGWHNNHHAFPRNAFHGMRWWQFDFAGVVIRMFERLGWAWNIQRISSETEQAQISRAQGMWNALGELRQSVLSSIAAARREWTQTALAFVQSRGEAQLQQWESLQLDTIQKLDAMGEAVARSAHLKRTKLLQYQKEAQRLMDDCKKRYAVVTGKMTVN